MEKYVLWIVTLVPISVLFLLFLIWIIRLKVSRDRNRLDEEIVLLTEKEKEINSYSGISNLDEREKPVSYSQESENPEKSNYLPQLSGGRYDRIVKNINQSFEWIHQYYRLVLKFHQDDSGWTIEVLKVVFLGPIISEVEDLNKYYITMVIVGQEFEEIKPSKTEPKKYQREILFGNKISVLNSMEKVVVELQLFSIDRYARHRLRSEIVVHIDRILKIHPSLQLDSLAIDVGNIEKEADAMNKNEMTSKNILLIFTSIYSYSTELLSIFVDQANPNMFEITRRYSEMELFLTLHIGEVILDVKYAQCFEKGSPNSYSNRKATVFELEMENLVNAQISLEVTIKTSLCSFVKSLTMFLLPHGKDICSIFHNAPTNCPIQNRILYSRNVVNSQLEEEKK